MKNKLHSSRIIKIVVIVLCVLAVIAVACAIIALASKLMHYGESASVKEQELAQTEETTEEISQDQLDKNIYSADGFYELDGIRFYYGGDYEGIAGVDVSSYQSDIDWELVKKSGVEFAMIRVGYRGWSSGELDLDNCFQEHMEGALEAGLDVGVYFFSQALTPEEAIQEAQYTLENIAGYEISCPIVYDWEEVSAPDARTNDMNMLLLTSCAEAFCQTIEQAGYKAGVYFNQAYGYEQLNLMSLKEYDFWLAEYADYPTFLYNFQMWQYTNEGKVPGIEGDVDLNIMFRKK